MADAVIEAKQGAEEQVEEVFEEAPVDPIA
jgi:hypothetical protein